MIILADSGSTKTAIRLLHNGNVVQQAECEGINPLLQSAEDIADVFPKFHAEVSHIHYFGAGCSTNERRERVRQALFKHYPAAHITVKTDLMAAAYAVYKGTKLSVCILGTGANAALFDGDNLHTPTPSLGYILGDEGSGADLGKELLRDYLYNRLPQDIRHSVAEHSKNRSAEEIVNRIYRGDFPNRYLAGYAPILLAHKNNGYVQSLLQKRFSTFINTFLMPHNHQDVAAVGSIAHYFRDELKQALEGYNLNLLCVRQNPIDGLIDFYRNFAI